MGYNAILPHQSPPPWQDNPQLRSQPDRRGKGPLQNYFLISMFINTFKNRIRQWKSPKDRRASTQTKVKVEIKLN